VEKMGAQIPDLFAKYTLDAIDWKVYFNSIVAQGIAVIPGFLIFGGWTWMMSHKGKTVDINTIAPKPEPFTKQQWFTVGCIVTLILLVVVPALPGMKQFFPKWMLLMASNVGTVGFVLAGLMMLFNVADSRASVKVMPWFVIMMVCGVTVLIEIMEKSGGLKAMVQVIAAFSGPTTVHFWLGLVTGVISAYSSSSGVVMPAFLPLVPGLLQQVPGADAVGMISSINIGAHLVDASPLSTLGALCIACAAEHEDKMKLFRDSSSVSWASKVRGSLTTKKAGGLSSRPFLLPCGFAALSLSKGWLSARLSSVFPIFLRPLHIQVIPLRVVDDHDGEVLHLQALNGLGTQVLPGDCLGFFYALCQERPGAPRCPEIDGLEFLHGFYHVGAAVPLADHALETQFHEFRGKGVHAIARRGSRRADGLSRLRGRRPHVVDHLAPDVDGQTLTLRNEIKEPLVSRIASGVDHPREKHLVAYFQPLHILIRQRSLQPDFRHA
jgi:hypothetical protein